MAAKPIPRHSLPSTGSLPSVVSKQLWSKPEVTASASGNVGIRVRIGVRVRVRIGVCIGLTTRVRWTGRIIRSTLAFLSSSPPPQATTSPKAISHA